MDNCQIAITKDFPPGRTWLLLTRSLAVARISPRLDPGAKCPADDDDDGMHEHDDDNDGDNYDDNYDADYDELKSYNLE